MRLFSIGRSAGQQWDMGGRGAGRALLGEGGWSSMRAGGTSHDHVRAAAAFGTWS